MNKKDVLNYFEYIKSKADVARIHAFNTFSHSSLVKMTDVKREALEVAIKAIECNDVEKEVVYDINDDYMNATIQDAVAFMVW